MTHLNFMLGLLALVLLIASPTVQAVSVGSTGGLNVATDTNFFLPAAATGDLCVGVAPLPAVFTGNAGAPVACIANGKTAAGVPVATTGLGYTLVPKFPSPVTNTGSITNGTETAAASWTSSGTNFLTRQATHTVSAFAATGIAAAESDDPWFFSPTVTTELDLLIEITNVSLSLASLGLNEVGTAAFSSVGGFGVGATPGQNILAEWDFFAEHSMEGDISIPSMILFQDTFTLDAGQTYWLTADVAATAIGQIIPEPSTWLLLGTGLLGLLGYGWRRKRRAEENPGPDLS